MFHYYILNQKRASKFQLGIKFRKCERLSGGAKTCRGRAQSAGLQPPLVVTQGHDHLPKPERVEVLQEREKIKQAAGASNDPPRSIIRVF